jgi:hypothetical protein
LKAISRKNYGLQQKASRGRNDEMLGSNTNINFLSSSSNALIGKRPKSQEMVTGKSRKHQQAAMQQLAMVRDSAMVNAENNDSSRRNGKGSSSALKYFGHGRKYQPVNE